MSFALHQRPCHGPVGSFGCEYCPFVFQSQQDRVQHTATHFNGKSCITCHKLLLCINGDWYELHASSGCGTENGPQQNNSNETYVPNEIKMESFEFVSDTMQAFKNEKNDNDSSDGNGRDNCEFDSLSIFEPHIEMKPIPQFVQSLARLKTNLTISRTKVKKSPIVRARESAQFKIVKVERRSQPIPKRPPKRCNNKTVFMDHRPLGSCICDICNKTLANFSTLRSHILHQHCLGPAERVSCTECGQTFSTPGNLKLHKRIHLKSKAFVCTYCGRGFNQMAGLKEHTNRHTGERPHKCPFCEKTFFRKTAQTAHMRVHTGVKPFKCKIEGCERAYMFDIDLKRHKYSVHGIYTKKHICPICNKVYPENKLLRKHLESHSTAQFESF